MPNKIVLPANTKSAFFAAATFYHDPLHVTSGLITPPLDEHTLHASPINPGPDSGAFYEASASFTIDNRADGPYVLGIQFAQPNPRPCRLFWNVATDISETQLALDAFLAPAKGPIDFSYYSHVVTLEPGLRYRLRIVKTFNAITNPLNFAVIPHIRTIAFQKVNWPSDGPEFDDSGVVIVPRD